MELCYHQFVFSLGPFIPKQVRKEGALISGMKTIAHNISKILPNAKSHEQLLPYTRRSPCGHTAGRSTSSSSLGLVTLVL